MGVKGFNGLIDFRDDNDDDDERYDIEEYVILNKVYNEFILGGYKLCLVEVL